ncbi:MAG: hypothetical protein ACOZDY_13865 [Pseudomonadota bacterium]
MSAPACPICFAPAAKVLQATQQTHGAVTCPRCGEFHFAPEAAAAWNGANPGERQIAHASAWNKNREMRRQAAALVAQAKAAAE